MNLLEPWNQQYLLAPHADVLTYGDENAVIDPVLHDHLRRVLGDPVVGYINGIHYEFRREESVPADTAVVPARNHDVPEGEELTLLVAR